MKQITLNYYNKGTFLINVIKESDTYLEGTFEMDDVIKRQMIAINALVDAEDEFWYLNDAGDRLEDEALFERSPWSVFGSRQKLVQRLMNYNTGRAIFSKATA